MALIRVPEIARRLGLSQAAIRRWILTGQIPVTRIGRTVSVDEGVVDQLIRENTTPVRTLAK